MALSFSMRILLAILLILSQISCNHATIANINKKEQKMISMFRKLAKSLSKDRLGINEVAAKIGSVESDPGFPMPIELKSSIEEVVSAQLSRYPDTNFPYVLTLGLSTDSHLTLSALKKQFGEFQQTRTDRGMPPEFLFLEPVKGAKWWVYIFVRLEQDGTPLEVRRISYITFRRDTIS